MKHYRILIDVAYDETTIPDDMHVQLHDNTVRCVECAELLDAGRTEKAMRWLGWLQGALWGLNFETLHDAKLRNAPEGAEYKGDA